MRREVAGDMGRILFTADRLLWCLPVCCILPAMADIESFIALIRL